jgi:hypothetical protein
MSRMSIATIDKPEFINVTPYNPLISECEIKVLYLGDNRNRSYISKEVATQMANTLPGCPIVGYYKDSVQDFDEHSERVIIDSDGVKFECLTKPYGFVAPDAKIWFQKFEDTDEFGNTVTREYLMTTGYLWTGQFEECQRVISQGNNQSMELDKDTLDGHWSKDYKKGVELFIINDAIFSKLCILGEDVEPCFEGSSITKPDVSTSFSKVDDDFKMTLFTMMEELKEILQGGEKMEFDVKKTEEVVVEENQPTDVPTDFKKEEKEEDKKEKTTSEENQDSTEDGKKSEEKKEDDEDKEKFAKKEDEDDKEDKSEEPKDEDDKSDKGDDDEDEKRKYSLLEEKYNDLAAKFALLEETNATLVEENATLTQFKADIEHKEKEELITSFYMLSDEDKKDVIENIDKYSLEDIEGKLSIICVRKKVNFNLDEEVKEEKKTEQVAVTFSLEGGDSEPAFLKALRNTKRTNC